MGSLWQTDLGPEKKQASVQTYKQRRAQMEWCQAAGSEGSLRSKYSFEGLLAEARQEQNRGAFVRSESLKTQLAREGRLETDGSIRAGKVAPVKTARARRARDLFAKTDDDDDDEVSDDRVKLPPTRKTLPEVAELAKGARAERRKVSFAASDTTFASDKSLEVPETDSIDKELAQPPPWRRAREARETDTYQSVADARGQADTSYYASAVSAARAMWYGENAAPGESSNDTAAATKSRHAPKRKASSKKKNKTTTTSSSS